MERAVDRGAVARAEIARKLGVVPEVGKDFVGNSRSSAAVRKITRAPGRAVRRISRQSAVKAASFIQSCASSST
jgi:hypothetical protein